MTPTFFSASAAAKNSSQVVGTLALAFLNTSGLTQSQFKIKNDANVKAQKDLATAIMSPEFQEAFNLNKGSIPVRLNMDLAKFDDCAKQSSADFVASSKGGSLVPSIAHGMAVPSAAEGAIKDAVSQFWNSDKMTAKEAMERIASAAKVK